MEVGGDVGGAGYWVMGPLYLCFIVFADDHLARNFVYFTVCLWLSRTDRTGCWLVDINNNCLNTSSH